MAGPVIRSSNLQFFLARAEQARVEAEAATLDHVRERCRRSQAAWTVLADKARRSELMRLEEADRKAAVAAALPGEDCADEAGSNVSQDPPSGGSQS